MPTQKGLVVLSIIMRSLQLNATALTGTRNKFSNFFGKVNHPYSLYCNLGCWAFSFREANNTIIISSGQ